MYWLENDVDAGEEEMPELSHIPISYIKKALLWAFYYLKNGY